MKLKNVCGFVLFLLLFVACGPAPEEKEGGTVEVKTTADNKFDPADLKIKVGDKVKFVLGASHNVKEVDSNEATTPKEGGFAVELGKTKEILFDKAGTFFYICQPHAAMGMRGKITVE